ncbi:MAG: flavodoxin family protein [Candidatus Latescibacteria bacterium]|jgi:multimeric flavodoxin WrbA|nr:flavodoxin family protein [Candidatus Latescibacterota bacterium]
MKILAFVGSRNPEGRSAKSAEAFIDGATGREGEVVILTEQEIERCRQCDEAGWGECRTEGQCVIEDDFASLVDKVGDADVVVFSTPVYFSDLSESMRAFTDRLRRVCMHESGKAKADGKPAIGICMAGGGGGGSPACMASLERVVSRCGFDVVDMVSVRRQNFDLKLDVLRATGKWMTGYSKSERDG